MMLYLFHLTRINHHFYTVLSIFLFPLFTSLILNFIFNFFPSLKPAFPPVHASNFFRQAHATGSCWEVMTYGAHNTDEWKTNLGLRYARGGCSLSPDVCLTNYLGSTSGFFKDYDKLFLAMKRDGAVVEDYAIQYSQKSLNYPKLHEIGFDDFYGFWTQSESNGGLNLNQTKLENTIANTKHTNPNLKFGITLYEDQLTLHGLDDARFPPGLRNKIDYVHLYLHYRKNGSNYNSYVETTKQKFPNAKIIAGSYAYDRINYLPCSQSGGPYCTKEEELENFNISITLHAQLLKNCVIEAIEFYPGYFGNEDSWRGWDTPRICLPERKQECIQNTRTMRDSALQILNSYKPTPTPNDVCEKKTYGDADCNGVIDETDYQIWRCFFTGNSHCLGPFGNFDPDFNKDRIINLIDLEIWRRNRFGQ